MRDIENILKTHIQNDEANTFAIIVPTDSARLKRQRELVGYHPNRAVANLRVHDIENFVQRLYTQVHPPRQHISHGLQNLWLHEIADPQSDNSDAYRYEAFRPGQEISVPDSTLSLVVDTINRFRERGETVRNIVTDNPTKVDLVHIYENYEAKLADQWIDEQGKHLHLANNFNSEFMRNAFPQVNLVVVEGFTVLSKADIKILTGIAGMPNIEMWFRTDYVEGNENLYRNIADLVRQFEAVGVNIDADYEREPELHQHFAKDLFRAEAEDVNLNHDPDTAVQIKVLKPADRSEEVEQIAHLIQKHVSDGDCKLSEICVACYNMGQYEQRIAEIFPAYGIPYSLIERLPLTRSEIVKAIFSRLSSRQVPLDGDYFSAVEPASHTRLFHPDAFQRYVDDLLKEGEVIQHILNPMLRKNREVVEGEIEAYRQFNRIVKELCSVLKSDGVESCSLDDYIEKLHHIAKHTNYQNRPATKAETVRIVQLGELRSLEFDVVFLGDFVEGRFPANYQPDPLLPEIPYRNEEEQLHDSRFMFYRVLKSFRKVLYLLTPKRERAADLIPSPFLGQLKALADVQEIEIADPTQGSTSGFLSTYSNHVWTSPVPSNENFPAEIAEMRPLINHVVMVEKSRENTHDHLDYEGVLTVETLSAVNRRRLERRREHIYSVTELEIYAKCPFQYFINNVLKFRVEEDETEDELSGLERGSLLHDVLFEFYNNRRNQKRPPIGQCSEEAFKEAKAQLNELLDSNAEKKRNRRKEKLIGENNLFWETDIEKLRIALHKWLAAERTYGLPVTPRYFEVSFGQERELRYPELSCREPITIGDVRMTGKIDRIDIGNGTFNIVDYKTGSSTVRMPEILSGRSLQLPIYLQTAKKLLEMHGGIGLEPAAGLYYKVRLDQFKAELGIGTESQNGDAYNAYNGRDWRPVSSRSGQLLADETFDARLARVSGYIQHYVDSISKGTFPLITRVETFVDSEEEGDTPITPRNKTEPCNYCSYKRVCRVGAISEVTQSDD
jgi:ATP-dependent helicase/nuclease subunit B